ncbi:MAG: hypothetical protein AB2L24_07875 [Mangrovibacterium sp.]
MNYIAIKKVVILSLLTLFTVTVLKAQSGFPLVPIDEQRVKEIEKMLADQPAGFGEPCHKREVWDKLLHSGAYDRFLEQMQSFVFPAFSEDDYFSLSKGTSSSSGPGLTMMRNRAKGLAQLTWAECLENKGRYVAAIGNGLRDILNQKSWVSPRNDFGFKNYNGVEYSVELTSALYAQTIAQTLYLMGNRLDPQLRKEAIAALYKRVFNPVLNKISTRNNEQENRFLVMTNNYNHVCLAGVVGAALAVIGDKHERAVFACIGEYYAQNGLMGFGEDGYCTEGMGYFNYGFGHFVQLRECFWQATRGKLDLFRNPKVQKIAWYPAKLEITDGVFPAISDSKEGASPDPLVMFYLNRNFRMGIDQYEQVRLDGKTDDNRMCVMMAFPNSATAIPAGSGNPADAEKLRSLFEQSAVLVVRPSPGSSCRLRAAFKGGNNAEHHNHNDVGSYTIVLGDEILAGDPGSIPYTADIFTAQHRYTYKTIGSYGHPVPLVAGVQQRPGKEARAVILDKSFSGDKDVLTLDIRSAYDVPALTGLERTMTYSRKGKGEITFEDRFSFREPALFETAIITRAQWTKLSDNTLLLEGKKEKLQVTLSSPGNKLSIRQEEIAEGGRPYVRIRIYLEKPVKAGKIIIAYKP